jgi:hypothetical protein
MNIETLTQIWAAGGTLTALGLAWDSSRWRRKAEKRSERIEALTADLNDAEARARGVGGRGEHRTTTIVPISRGIAR